MSNTLNFVLFKKATEEGKKDWTNSCILSFYFEIKIFFCPAAKMIQLSLQHK